MARLYRFKIPNDSLRPLGDYLEDVSIDWNNQDTEEPQEGWLGKMALMAGMKRPLYTSTPFLGKTINDAGINVYGCAALTTKGEIEVVIGEFAFLRGNHKIQCPSGGRFVSMAACNLVLTAIGDDGALYMYQPGKNRTYELIDRIGGMTFYRIKGTMFGSELICSCSHGFVAIKAGRNPLVTVQAHEGNVSDFALFYSDRHRVVYATDDGDLHYLEISLEDAVPIALPINLGNVQQLTGMNSPIVRLEASPNSFEFWAIDDQGRCYEGEFAFHLDFPLTKFDLIPDLDGVCDVVIGHLRQARYASTWDGRVYPLYGDKVAVDCVPIAKVIYTVREALMICLPPKELFHLQ